MAAKFKTVQDVLTDEIFIELLTEKVNGLVESKSSRPEPGKGKKYRRDWQDKLEDLFGKITPELFLSLITEVWSKKSKLSSELRAVVDAIASDVYKMTLIHYIQEAEKAEEQVKEETT